MIKAIISDISANTYIIHEKNQAYIIDPGMNLDLIRTYIRELELEVQGVLLTHGHFDHIYCLNELVEEYNCNIYLHELERDFLFDPNLNLSGITYNKFTVKSKKNVITITDKDTFALPKNTITLLLTPGHTRGSVTYLYKDTAITGDLLFRKSIGRTDLPTSNEPQIYESLKMIIKTLKDNTLVYPGHGDSTTILSEKHDNPFLR